MECKEWIQHEIVGEEKGDRCTIDMDPSITKNHFVKSEGRNKIRLAREREAREKKKRTGKFKA